MPSGKGGMSYANFIWNRERNFVFTYVPKVACTNWKSVMRYLASQPDWLNPRLAHDRANGGLHYIDPAGAEREILSDPSVPKYSCVRNPYSRALSAYLNKFDGRIKGGVLVAQRPESERRVRALEQFRRTQLDPGEYPEVNFEVFLLWVRDGKTRMQKNEHWAPQTAILQPDKVNYAYVGRFENLAEDASEILRLMGCDIPFPSHKQVRFPANNAGSRLDVYLTPVCRDLIAEMYAEDFRVFGYELDAVRQDG